MIHIDREFYYLQYKPCNNLSVILKTINFVFKWHNFLTLNLNLVILYSQWTLLQSKFSMDTPAVQILNGHSCSSNSQWALLQFKFSLDTPAVQILNGHSCSSNSQWALLQFKVSMDTPAVQIPPFIFFTDDFFWTRLSSPL